MNYFWKDGKQTSIGIEPCSFDLINLEKRRDVELLSKSRAPIVIIGGGSNCIIANIDGVKVIRCGFDKMHMTRVKNVLDVDIGAGAELNTFVQMVCNEGDSFLSNLSGIPGTIGGAVIQNAGAFSTEIASFIKSVHCWDRLLKLWVDLQTADCNFDYRSSIFLQKPNRYFIYSIKLRIEIENFSNHENFRSYTEIVRERRLKFPDPLIFPNSGSVLIHPHVLPGSEFQKKTKVLNVQCIPVNNKLKIPLGAILEVLGYKNKNFFNGLVISSMHSNIIVRQGNTNYLSWIQSVTNMQNDILKHLGLLPRIEPIILGKVKQNKCFTRPIKGLRVIEPQPFSIFK